MLESASRYCCFADRTGVLRRSALAAPLDEQQARRPEFGMRPLALDQAQALSLRCFSLADRLASRAARGLPPRSAAAPRSPPRKRGAYAKGGLSARAAWWRCWCGLGAVSVIAGKSSALVHSRPRVLLGSRIFPLSRQNVTGNRSWWRYALAAWAAATTLSACSRVSTGLIGIARCVRAACSVAGSSTPAAHSRIGAWRWTGVR